MHYYFDYNPNLLDYARENRQYPTLAEKTMWISMLKKKNTKFRFLRQKPIKSFIVDFYCSKLLLAIEIDGDSHELQRKYDYVRTKKINEYGIKVIRFKNEEVLYSQEAVFRRLMNEIEKRKAELESGSGLS